MQDYRMKHIEIEAYNEDSNRDLSLWEEMEEIKFEYMVNETRLYHKGLISDDDYGFNADGHNPFKDQEKPFYHTRDSLAAELLSSNSYMEWNEGTIKFMEGR